MSAVPFSFPGCLHMASEDISDATHSRKPSLCPQSLLLLVPSCPKHWDTVCLSCLWDPGPGSAAG